VSSRVSGRPGRVVRPWQPPGREGRGGKRDFGRWPGTESRPSLLPDGQNR